MDVLKSFAWTMAAVLGLLLADGITCKASGQSESAEPPSAETPSGEPDAEQPAPADEPPADETPSEDAGEEQPNDEVPKADRDKSDDEVEQDKAAADPPPAELPASISLNEFFVLPKVGLYGRAAIHVDKVEAALVRGDWQMPAAGATVVAPGGREVQWKRATVGADGKLSTRTIQGGYAAASFESPAEGIMLLRASGHAAVYVNGEPRAGNPYALEVAPLPIQVRRGLNELVFHIAGPELQVELEKPEAAVLLAAEEATLPSLVRGEVGRYWASVTVVNAGTEPLAGASIEARLVGQELVNTPLAWLDAASSRKASFELLFLGHIAEPDAELELRIVRGGEILATMWFAVHVVEPGELHLRTFRSRIDHSVQSYAVQPAIGYGSDLARQLVHDKSADESPYGVLLALHGAGVGAQQFAEQYQAKPWAHVIAPAGRGPYGFDWEAWARIDALEALADAQEKLPFDARRVYVTGHAMGGHGALVLATTAPDRFAAVGTSGAWSSLWSYGGGLPKYREPTPVQAMLRRAATPSDTLRYLDNLKGLGVYLLHGTEDVEVPIEQSRLILTRLSAQHNDFAFYGKQGAGHWWDQTTVDWPAMMDFFQDRQRADESPLRVVLSTSDLGVMAERAWVSIAQQETPLEVSTVELESKAEPLSIIGTTKNVKRLSIDKDALPRDEPFVVRLDGGREVAFRGMPASGKVWLEKRGDRWRRVYSPDNNSKGPQRYGGFQSVFDHHALLVYGTRGSKEENAWARAKARFDAETFAYRGNGALQMVPDTEFDVAKDQDRNVILYGNADTNGAWPALLSTCPVQMRRGRITVDIRPELGDDLGMLLVRPRPGSDTAVVGVVGGTGLAGMRLTNRLRYFVSGIAYPDLIILGGGAVEKGDGDVRAAGYFGNDWGLDEADIAWRDLVL